MLYFVSFFFRSVPSLKKMVCLIYVHQSMTQVNRLADHPMDPSFLVLWLPVLGGSSHDLEVVNNHG